MNAVQKRILLLLSLLATAFVAAGFGWQAMQKQQAEFLAANARRERQQMVARILHLHGRSLEALAADYSQWDEMVRFVQRPDGGWARRNLDCGLSTFRASGLWIYDKDFRPVHSIRARGVGDYPVSPDTLRKVFAVRALTHFFVHTSGGILEVRGARIHRASDPERTGERFGCVLTGRLWDDTYLEEIGALTGTRARFGATGMASLAGSSLEPLERVSFSHDLPGWNGIPVARLDFASDADVVGSVTESTSSALSLFVIFAALVFGVLSLSLLHWVSQPLSLITESLRSHDPAVLSPLRSDRTEFGDLSRLVSAFFHQKELLEAEITERREAQAALAQARDQLEIRVRERTAELAAANTSLAEEVEERKRAATTIRGLNVHLERRLQRLGALRQIDVAIASTLDLRLVLRICLEQVVEHLQVDGAAVLLPRHGGGLEYGAVHGVKLLRGVTVQSGSEQATAVISDHAVRAVVERRTVHVVALDHIPAALAVARPDMTEEISYHAVPLMAKDSVNGVLEIFHRPDIVIDPEWADFLETLAGQIAIAIDNATLFDGLKRSNRELTQAYDATIEGWSRALDLRDKETEGHSRRVTDMSVRLARAVGMSEQEIVHVRRGALLHDIGKISIPDGILLKPGPLTDAEWEIMKRHPQYAYDMLHPIVFLRPALDIPYCHHEKWDGTGYPQGLEGEDIPLSARIFAVVDVWDALRSDRPYRAGWPEERVLDHIRSLAGSHFDPRVVEAFLQVAALDRFNATLPALPKAA